MLFTFKRDDEGRERIYVGGACVARLWEDKEWEFEVVAFPTPESVVMEGQIDAAIERADEAGFWRAPKAVGMTVSGGLIIHGPCFQVTVDVPVADSTVLSVTTGEDQS